MREIFVVGATLFLAVLAGACSVDEPRAAADEPRASADEPPASPASGRVSISDEEIDGCIAWWRADLDLGRRHLEEMNRFAEGLEAKYTFAEIHKIQEDPELLALLERQREERLEHRRSLQVPREKVDGFESVLAGLGRSLNRDGRTVYEVHHEESALRGARDKYGDEFVDKVLSREDEIAAALQP